MRLFKFCCWLLPIVLLWFSNEVIAQGHQNFKLYLRNGTVEPPANLSGKAGATLRENTSYEIGRLVIIQFYNIPDQRAVEQLKNAGIKLLEYVPDNAYTAVVRETPDITLLNSVNARSIIELASTQKIHPVLMGSNLPEHVMKMPGKVDVQISYPRSIALADVRQDLGRNNFEVISDSLSQYEMLEVRLEKDRLEQLAALPWLQYIEPVPAPDVLLNDKSTSGTRANMVAAGLPSGVKLDGEGVVIGIGDSGNPIEHGDMSGRIVSYTPGGSDWHGFHVTGTAAGAGIVNEKFKGYAPKALIAKHNNREIWKQAPSLFRDFGMVVTNNSYGTAEGGGGCPGFGAYTGYSYLLDRQANELPYLQHVFAAGNSGTAGPCNGFAAGFGNVHGDYASAKNIISVGRTLAMEGISLASSKGPVQDGRIKPDLVAPGTGIYSTMPNNAYEGASGTSMAAPAVTGGAALLYQRYRQLHDQQNPKSALVKALLLNGASDKGLVGPDFSYGFGLMNLFRSVMMIEKVHYVNGTLTHQASNEFQITVPSGTALVKAMLYWNDVAASPLAGSKSLVNNLDLEGAGPDGSRLFPLVPNPATPGTQAVANVDSVNNAEQIVITNPVAGTYSLKVKGTKVPSGPQEYFLVYDIVEKSVVLTYPIGSEHFTKGDAIYISWDSYGNPASTFAVSYSLNNGGTWTTINAAVPAGTTQLSWTVPDASTASAKIRLVQNETGVVKESGPFSIMGVPVISLALIQCPSYAAVQWTAVSGASDYEVMRLQGSEMKPVAVTTALKYTFSGLSPDSTYYISVRPRMNGIPGRRAVAISRKPDSGTCEGAISDNDIGIDSLISPTKSGRMLTSSSLSATHAMTIGIRNFDDQPVTRSFEVGYSIGDPGAAVHWETIASGIPGQGYLQYTFNKTADLHAIGTYSIRFFVKLDGDLVTTNNTRAIVIRQLGNPSLSLPYSEDFESVAEQTMLFDTKGLGGAEKYDFASQDSIGRLRTYVSPGLAYSGTKALTLDANNWGGYEYMTSVTGTYNLNGYHVQNDEVRLTFRFRQYNTYDHYAPDVGVYIRGKDTDPWIFAFDYRNRWYLPVDKGFMPGTIDVTDLLRKNSQDFTTSFQVMWRQRSYYPVQTDGYTIDDIQIFKTRSDAELARIVQPPLPVCDDNFQYLDVVVRNNGTEDLYELPIQLMVDGNEVYKGNIPVVRAGKDTLNTFSFNSNLNIEGDHVVKALVGKVLDVNPANDSATLVFKTPLAISTYPYLEDFEHGDGGWQVLGGNSAWQFGHPNSSKVKGAASGQNAWKTNLTGPYQANQISYLYSPCFNTSGMNWPTLSFSFAVDLEACKDGTCDIAFIEYNTGDGWQKLGGVNYGFWYNVQDKDGEDGWNLQDSTRWHGASVYLPGNGGYGGHLRLRFALKGGSSNSRDGIAIDDIHIHDQGYIFDSVFMDDSTGLEDIRGDQWVDLKVYESKIASINPNNQELGQISVKTYIDTTAVKHSNGQYYLGRTYKITTSQPAYPKPVGVRLYFSDWEVERVIAMPDNTGIKKPVSPYNLAITKYSGANEDGDLANNSSQTWSYYPASAVKTVPYRYGYYVEFQTKTFSEFWLGNGFLGLGDPMPVTLSAFSAKVRRNVENKESVLLEWQTTQEEAFSHFEIEVAKDRESLLKKTFLKIGEVPGKGGSSPSQKYSFTDNFPSANGTSYYRLKMVDRAADGRDGSFEYSSIRAVSFDREKQWKVFPNPAEKRIFVEFEEKAGKLLRFSISDIAGRVVFTDNVRADGSVQKKEIDLSSGAVTPGIYLLKVVSDDRERVFKIIRK